jgi:hypothetical protein
VLGGRPGQTTFRVRNHDWSKEGLLPWLHGTEEGWSYVIAHERRLCRGRLFRPARDHRRTTLESGSPRNPPDALCDWRDVLPRECVGRVRDGLV